MEIGLQVGILLMQEIKIGKIKGTLLRVVGFFMLMTFLVLFFNNFFYTPVKKY